MKLASPREKAKRKAFPAYIIRDFWQPMLLKIYTIIYVTGISLSPEIERLWAYPSGIYGINGSYIS